MITTNQEQALQTLWNEAAKTNNRAALANLRDAFEALALGCDDESERAANKARQQMGHGYFTKTGKQRTCYGCPVYKHTGSWGADSYACTLEDAELLAHAERTAATITRLQIDRPAGWGTTRRNQQRDLRAYRGEIRRRGL
tara:strand:+ start:368 stop:790 length:423 start_codon:yes stop_codon:yes gene_type:complete